MRIALFGGTFNPPHRGHEQLGEIACAELQLDELLVMPNHLPPHKLLDGDLSADDRLRLCQALCEAHRHWHALDWEVRRDGPSFTYDTLARLAETYPTAERFFVLGADAARGLPSWHRAAHLGELAQFAVIGRAGEQPISPSEREQLARALPNLRLHWLRCTDDDSASSAIRAAWAAGNTAALPEAVVAELRQLRADKGVRTTTR